MDFLPDNYETPADISQDTIGWIDTMIGRAICTERQKAAFYLKMNNLKTGKEGKDFIQELEPYQPVIFPSTEEGIQWMIKKAIEKDDFHEERWKKMAQSGEAEQFKL